MARHRTPDEKRELGERARALRAAGRSRREIRAELRVGDDLLDELLRGTPVPDTLRRPRAKDGLRAAAVELRLAGKTYDEIAAQLRVSKSSCSLWLRDLPRPEDDPVRRAEAEERRTSALRARLGRDREARDQAVRVYTQSVARSLGAITRRDLVPALAISYWCEGAKSKPWNRHQVVQWMNSDPVLVGLFLEGLAHLGVERERLVLRVHIHETADADAARRWWSEQTGVPLEQFRRSSIKRHKPLSRRQNVHDDYRGCLSVSVLQSRRLYQQVDGLVRGLAGQPRSGDGWQDGAGTITEPQDDGDVPSALV